MPKLPAGWFKKNLKEILSAENEKDMQRIWISNSDSYSVTTFSQSLKVQGLWRFFHADFCARRKPGCSQMVYTV